MTQSHPQRRHRCAVYRVLVGRTSGCAVRQTPHLTQRTSRCVAARKRSTAASSRSAAAWLVREITVAPCMLSFLSESPAADGRTCCCSCVSAGGEAHIHSHKGGEKGAHGDEADGDGPSDGEPRVGAVGDSLGRWCVVEIRHNPVHLCISVSWFAGHGVPPQDRHSRTATASGTALSFVVLTPSAATR